jgi:ABC-2 type transport system ATP-binding protein
VPGIGAATVLRDTDGTAVVSFVGSPDLRPKLARALVNSGVDLLRIDRGAARLESIFLQLTKGNPQ